MMIPAPCDATVAAGGDPLAALLAQHFHFAAFNPGQREPVDAILGGHDAVVVMPTGAGKSVCFQLPAMALPGVTLVVSPLISLMKDQVDNLVDRGLPATCLNSSLSLDEATERIRAVRRGETRLIYVAPERFRNPRFQALLSELQVSLLAIDEAHCISQWGHDFRPDYLRLREIVTLLPRARIMALTATATPEVRADIVRQLGLGIGGRPEPRVFVRGFRRDNLRLVVESCRSHGDKLERIRQVLSRFPTGIVYCSTRKQVERVGQMLAGIGLKHLIYHAGLADEPRARAQDRFMGGEVPVVVATNAFGMGVDRSDLRFVIHWDIPGSIEAYYQEVGRAGRDGALAHCELLYNYADVGTQQFFLDGSNPDPSLVLNLWSEVRALLQDAPLTESMDHWAERLTATDNKVTVHTCLGLFDRAGLIERSIVPGQRCYTTALAKNGDLERLKAMLPAIEEKRKRDQAKLDIMVRYVNARGCRHRFILDYFGDAEAGAAAGSAACGRCDTCGFSAVVPPRPPTEDEWLVLQKLLSCVGRLDGRFGRNTILSFACATPSTAITTHKLEQMPTHGILKEEREDYLRALFDQLVTAGAIALGPAPYHVASLTPLGREVAWRRQTVSLPWPTRRVAPAPASLGDGPPWARAKPARARKGTAVRAAAPAGDAEGTLSAAEKDVLQRLKEWRRQEAADNEVPAFTICSNRTLRALAVERPGTLSALERIHGIGPAKLEAYGSALLAVLSKAK
jgi:ATP-dependent DNA helicase RecQ